MRIIFLGTGGFGLPVLEAIHSSPHTLLGVVSGHDKAQGRALSVQASPIKRWAQEQRIPVLDCNTALKAFEADVWVVVSFGALLGKEMLALPRICALNVHGSLLPAYRGASPIQSALLHGNSETGVSIIRLTEKLDAGDVLLQKKIPVLPADYFFDLETKLSMLSAPLLMDSLSLLQTGQAVFQPQEEAHATHCRKISKEQGHVQWNEFAETIRNRVRAFQKWPGSYSFYRGKRILWHQADLDQSLVPPRSHPGMILKGDSAHELKVAAKDKALLIRSCQLEGRRVLSAADFLKGFRLEPGRVLE